MKIKIGIRKNLFYPMMIIIYSFARKVDTIIMNKTLKFESSSLLTLVMFISELLSGFYFFCLYSKNSSGNNNSQLMEKTLIYNPKFLNINIPDNIFKIYFLIILISFFDFNVFVLQNSYYKIFNQISITLDMRIKSILTISNALLCYYVLKKVEISRKFNYYHLLHI